VAGGIGGQSRLRNGKEKNSSGSLLIIFLDNLFFAETYSELVKAFAAKSYGSFALF
jgi:hypothetical protein